MNIKKIWLRIISKKRYDEYKAENTKRLTPKDMPTPILNNKDFIF